MLLVIDGRRLGMLTSASSDKLRAASRVHTRQVARHMDYTRHETRTNIIATQTQTRSFFILLLALISWAALE